MKKIILEKEYSFDRSNEDVGYHYVTENLTVKIATKNVVITETVFHSIAWGANVDVTKVYFSITEFKEHKLEKVFTNPQHSYTKMLLESTPSIVGEKRKLRSLDGEPPSLIGNDNCCLFSYRCPNPTDGCKNRSVEMQLIKFEEEH